MLVPRAFERGRERFRVSRQDFYRHHDDEIHGDDAGGDSEDEQEDQPARQPAGLGLPPEEIHVGSDRRVDQVKLTFGTSRFCGDSISSICAGSKPNEPAMMLFGNTSRVLL